jgi:hypothetical protein
MHRIYLVFLISIGIAQAQMSTGISFSSFWDDNVFRSPLAQSELLNDIGLNFSYVPEDNRFTYQGGLSYLSYLENNTRNFSTLDAAVRLQLPINHKKTDFIFSGLELSSRLNSPEYDYYNFTQLHLYFNLNRMMSGFLLRSGLSYRYRSYSQLPDLTNSTYTLFTQINRSFPTRTSVFFEADLGYKEFAGIMVFDSTLTSGGGPGRGQYSSGSYSNAGEFVPSMTQIVLLGRIAQSLSDQVGIYFQYRWQRIVNTQSEYQNQSDFYQDEEIFDDPFSYHAQTYSSRLTLLLPLKIQLFINGSFSRKDYHHEYAWLSATDSLTSGGLRQDDVTIFNPVLSRTFQLKNKNLDSVNLEIEYYFRKNESNSYWYNYDNNVVLSTLSLNF